MKSRYSILLFFLIWFGTAKAQTVEQAKALFNKGEYEEAKPVFEKQVKSQPNNANYNYWYGVCCLKTGEAEKSIKYLEFAHKRKVPKAPLYLGEAFDELYRFEDAVSAYEDYIDIITKKKEPTEEAEALLERSKTYARMVKGVENVVVIDSFIVDKKNFLEAYKISEESGKIYTYNTYFEEEGNNKGTVYETELGNKIYYSELGEDSTLNIMSKNKLLNEWSKGTFLPFSINASGNANYPFVLTDGITLYYAFDGETSLGGYDIFVTRYNSGTDTYLTPENVGMPFNSPFNDYMYVIDEFNNLGWFASDRYQPEEKVCIYVFIPNAVKQTYNYEAMDSNQIRNLAQLHSIKDTWKNEEDVAQARKRLEESINYQPMVEQKYDFSFIINDRVTYHSQNEFTSPTASEIFKEYQQREKDYQRQKERLEEQRAAYTKANNSSKTEMTPAIIDLEKRVLEMYNEVENLKKKIRNDENNHINN